MTFPGETGSNSYSSQKEKQWLTKVTIPPWSHFSAPVCLLGLFTRVWTRSYLRDCVWLKDGCIIQKSVVASGTANEIKSRWLTDSGTGRSPLTSAIVTEFQSTGEGLCVLVSFRNSPGFVRCLFPEPCQLSFYPESSGDSFQIELFQARGNCYSASGHHVKNKAGDCLQTH